MCSVNEMCVRHTPSLFNHYELCHFRRVIILFSLFSSFFFLLGSARVPSVEIENADGFTRNKLRHDLFRNWSRRNTDKRLELRRSYDSIPARARASRLLYFFAINI